jgi:predicted transcriptional regulator
LIESDLHMNTRVVIAHLPTDLAKKLDDLALRLDRPKGWIVRAAVASFISLEEKRFQLTLEALKNVDAKHTVDHSEIEAWAKGLSKPNIVTELAR